MKQKRVEQQERIKEVRGGQNRAFHPLPNTVAFMLVKWKVLEGLNK